MTRFSYAVVISAALLAGCAGHAGPSSPPATSQPSASAGAAPAAAPAVAPGGPCEETQFILDTEHALQQGSVHLMWKSSLTACITSPTRRPPRSNRRPRAPSDRRSSPCATTKPSAR